MLARAALPGECRCAGGAAARKVRAHGLVVERALEGGGERRGIGSPGVEGGAPGYLDQGRIVARDAGNAAGHRFQQGQSESLVARSEERRVGKESTLRGA